MKKIILVEDEKMLRELLIMQIGHYKSHRCTVEAHANYDFEPVKADCYILDHDIKDGMSGSDWIKHHSLQEIEPHRRILMPGRHFVWMDSGIAGIYLDKPFRNTELYNALDEVLRNDYNGKI